LFKWWSAFGFPHHMICFFFVMVFQRNILPFSLGWLNWFMWMLQWWPQEHNLLSCLLGNSVQFHVTFSFYAHCDKGETHIVLFG
jgi:hypothetical protein